jgi:hypothetical protein
MRPASADLSRPEGAQVKATLRAALGEPQFAETIEQARTDFADARHDGIRTGMGRRHSLRAEGQLTVPACRSTA